MDSSIETCELHGLGPARTSFPSGHATLAFSLGVMPAALNPEKAQSVLERAHDYAENRLLCGMHFRSDIMAGQELGVVMAVKLTQDARLVTEMDAARADLRSQHRGNYAISARA